MTEKREKGKSIKAGCSLLTIVAGVAFCLPILFMRGYDFTSKVVSIFVVLLATWGITRLINFVHKLRNGQ